MVPVAPLLGVMETDRFTHHYSALPMQGLVWLQEAGGFAALGLLLWFIYALFSPSPAVAGGRRQLISRFQAIVGGLSFLIYLVAIGLSLYIWIDDSQSQIAPGQPRSLFTNSIFLGCGCW